MFPKVPKSVPLGTGCPGPLQRSWKAERDLCPAAGVPGCGCGNSPAPLPSPPSVSPCPVPSSRGKLNLRSLCPGAPLSSSPSLISRGKPGGNAPLEQTASPGSNRRGFGPHKVWGFSLLQPSEQAVSPQTLPGFQCLGVFLVLPARSSSGGLQPPPAGNQRSIP